MNQVGANDELIFDGASFVVNEEGKRVVQLKAFEEDIKVFDIDELKILGNCPK